jgi:hypothetical protein
MNGQEWQCAAFQPAREGFPVNQFENEKLLAVGFDKPVNRADVRMSQRGEHLRFPAEPRDAFGIVCNTLGKDLQRDVAIQLRVACATDLAHAAGAEGVEYLVRTKSSACNSQGRTRLRRRSIGPNRPAVH